MAKQRKTESVFGYGPFASGSQEEVLASIQLAMADAQVKADRLHRDPLWDLIVIRFETEWEEAKTFADSQAQRTATYHTVIVEVPGVLK